MHSPMSASAEQAPRPASLAPRMQSFGRARAGDFAPWRADLESLPTARGVVWKDGYRGHLTTAVGPADVRVDGTASAHIRLAADAWPDRGRALALNAVLPMNLRFAGPTHGHDLCADVWLDGPSFATGVSEFRRGVRLVSAGASRLGPAPAAAAGPYAELFEELGGGDSTADVVEREPGWELGTRFRGRRIAVRISPERTGLRLHRTVLDRTQLAGLQGGPQASAVSDVALRMNARMRFVRLAMHETGLAVEACLVRGVVAADRVLETARAIAVVSATVKLPLKLLMQNEGVARCYAGAFHLTNGDEES